MRIAKIKWLRVGIIAFLGFVFLFVIYLLVPHTKAISLANGAKARIEAASYVRSWRPNATCKIWYNANSGQKGLIEFRQDALD